MVDTRWASNWNILYLFVYLIVALLVLPSKVHLYLWLATYSFCLLKINFGHQGCQNKVLKCFAQSSCISAAWCVKEQSIQSIMRERERETIKYIKYTWNNCHISHLISYELLHFARTVQKTISRHNPFVLKSYIPVVLNKCIVFFKLLLSLVGVSNAHCFSCGGYCWQTWSCASLHWFNVQQKASWSQHRSEVSDSIIKHALSRVPCEPTD